MTPSLSPAGGGSEALLLPAATPSGGGSGSGAFPGPANEGRLVVSERLHRSCTNADLPSMWIGRCASGGPRCEGYCARWGTSDSFFQTAAATAAHVRQPFFRKYVEARGSSWHSTQPSSACHMDQWRQTQARITKNRKEATE